MSCVLHRPRAASLWFALGMLAAAGLASAHTKSETYIVAQILGSAVRVTFTLPIVEANRLGTPGMPPSDERIASYLAAHVGASSGRRPCQRVGEVRAGAATAQFRRFQLAFQCPATADIALHSSAFFALVPSHLTLAQIETNDGELIEQLFTKDHQTVAGERRGGALQNAGFLQYVQLGIMHIFTGVDHMSFLLGLVLLSRRVRDLAFVITGFTLGHSATLALAVTGVIRPHAEFIDALVALTIALVGAENVAVASGRPQTVAAGVGSALLVMAILHMSGWGVLPTTLLLGAGIFSCSYLLMSSYIHDAARLRLVVTLVFGLIHGFGFASDLLEMKLPTQRLAELLVGFNLGVEIGQLAVVFALLGAVALLARARLSLPRPIVVDVGSAALVGIGTFWFISRSFI
ncbi:MAG TPA: HupE/UreJ family protein [Steroidobacteraceae bacterium]|nr:HupE/UreJ family protein [Steroidobacteraceae bacterium]